MSRKFIYAAEDASASVRGNVLATVFSSLTVGFALALVALFFIVFVNLRGFVESFGERTHVIAYVSEGVVDPETIKKGVAALPGVKSFEYVSKEKALSRLKAELAGQGRVFEGIAADILPASIEITVTDEFRRPDRILETIDAIRKEKWVAEVQYGQENIEKISSLIAFFELAATVLGLFLGAAAVFIISNNVRMTVYARRGSIEVMRLVGASDAYIKIPFFLEGLLVGFCGGLVAAGLLWLNRFFFVGRIPAHLEFIINDPFGAPALVGGLVAAGMLIGLAGCLISMSRFLRD